MFGYYLWYFLLLFPLQCCVYQPFIIPGKEETCKIFSPYSSLTSRPRLFSIKLFYSSVFQCYIPQKEQNTTTKKYCSEVWLPSKALHWPLLCIKTPTPKEKKEKNPTDLFKCLGTESQFLLGQNSYLIIQFGLQLPK